MHIEFIKFNFVTFCTKIILLLLLLWIHAMTLEFICVHSNLEDKSVVPIVKIDVSSHDLFNQNRIFRAIEELKIRPHRITIGTFAWNIETNPFQSTGMRTTQVNKPVNLNFRYGCKLFHNGLKICKILPLVFLFAIIHLSYCAINRKYLST